MKKFKFIFETLLKLKTLDEQQAQKDLQDIKAKVRKEEQVLYQMYESIEDSYQLGLQYKVEGKEVPPKLDVVDTFIKGQGKRIEVKREEIRRLKQVEEEKYEIWLQKRKEMKSLELLKDKKIEEFRKEVNKKEAKKLDDMVTVRFRGEDTNG
jgi:flagellar protein FliJ